MSLGKENFQHIGLHDNEELETFGIKTQQHHNKMNEEIKPQFDLQNIISKYINTDIFSSSTNTVIIFVAILLIIFYSFFSYSSNIAIKANINKSQIDDDKSFTHNNPTHSSVLPNSEENGISNLSPTQIEQKKSQSIKAKHQYTKQIIEERKRMEKQFKKPKKEQNKLIDQGVIEGPNQKKQSIQFHGSKQKHKQAITKQFLPIEQQITHQIFTGSFERRALSNLQIGEKSSFADKQKQYYEQKYGISKFSQLPFCIILPTENNGAKRKYLRSIRSIIMQDYLNYHFIVIDNASTDKTGALMEEELLKQKKVPSSNYKIIKNNERKTELQIIMKAARQFCKPNEIMMVIDGGDELIGAQVLKLFNARMQMQDLMVAYSNSLVMPGMIGYSYPYPPNVIEDASFSSHTFLAEQLRVFYVQLILNIKQEDLKDRDGSYFDVLPQLAYMLPILQQAHTKVAYIPEIAYYSNRDKPNTENSNLLELKAKSSEKIMRMRQKYAPFSFPPAPSA